MPNVPITIRMPKESLRLWLEALRSGKYKQGKSRLLTHNGSMCCLGVMEHCLTGEVEHRTVGDGLFVAHSLPTLGWLRKHSIEFAGYEIATGKPGELGEREAPFLPTLNLSAFSANDNGGFNFHQIADAIEACAEGF